MMDGPVGNSGRATNVGRLRRKRLLVCEEALQRPGNKPRCHSCSAECKLRSFKKIRIAVANRNVTWPPGKAVYVPRADPAGNTWKIHSRYGDSDGKLEWGGVDDDALIDEV